MTRMAGLAALSARPTPETVPPVPKDAAVRIAQDFAGGRRLVDGRIGRVLKLARHKRAGMRGGDLPGFFDSAGHPLGAACQNKLGAERGEQQPAFGAHGFRHGQHKAVSARRADKRQPDAGIAGGRLDNKRAG